MEYYVHAVKNLHFISKGVFLLDYTGSYLNLIKRETIRRKLLLGPQRSALLPFFSPRRQVYQFIYLT